MQFDKQTSAEIFKNRRKSLQLMKRRMSSVHNKLKGDLRIRLMDKVDRELMRTERDEAELKRLNVA